MIPHMGSHIHALHTADALVSCSEVLTPSPLSSRGLALSAHPEHPVLPIGHSAESPGWDLCVFRGSGLLSGPGFYRRVKCPV